MSDKKFSAIRARLKYETLSQFRTGYSKFVSTGGMFIPVPEQKLKPVGATIRFQFLLADGSTALLGEGTVLQVREPNPDTPRSPVGMLIKFSKLSPESKKVVDEIVAQKDEHKTPTQEVEEVPVRDSVPTPRSQLPAQDRNGGEAYGDEDKTYEMSVDQFMEMQKEAETHDTHPGSDPFGRDVEHSSSLEQPTSPVQDIEPSEQFYSPESEEIRAAIAPTPIEPSDNSSETANIEPPEELIASTSQAAIDLEEESSEPLFQEPSEPALAEESSEPILAEEVVEEPEAPKPVTTALDEPSEGAVRVLSYDDMSKVEGDDFGFTGEESEIDDMFDDLFGTTDNDSFFDDILGGGESQLETLDPEDLMPASEAVVESPEPPPIDDVEEPPITSPDISQDDVSLDDIFESDSELDDEPADAPEPIEPLTADDTISDLYTAPTPEAAEKDENPFRAEEEHSSPLIPTTAESEPAIDLGTPINEEGQNGMFDAFDNPAEESSAYEEISSFETVESEPVFEAFDESSPAIEQPSEPSFNADFDLDVANDEPQFDSSPDIARDSGPRELDNLLEHLTDDVPVGVASTLNLGGDPEPDPDAPLQQIEESDGESLEALLALANKDIETKRDAEPDPNEDILDQLLGDDLPLPPTDAAPSFGSLPTPDKKEKKGFMSKLFGKD